MLHTQFLKQLSSLTQQYQKENMQLLLQTDGACKKKNCCKKYKRKGKACSSCPKF